MTDIFNLFLYVFQKCVVFLTTETFGLPFPIGLLFILLFVLGLVIRYILLLAN